MLSAYVRLANIYRPGIGAATETACVEHCTHIMPNMFCFDRALLYAALMGQNDTRTLSKKAVGATSHAHSGQDDLPQRAVDLDKVFQSSCVMCLLR